MKHASLKIKIDLDSGEAELLPVDQQPIFEGRDDLFIMDILQDISFDLTAMYIKASNKLWEGRNDR